MQHAGMCLRVNQDGLPIVEFSNFLVRSKGYQLVYVCKILFSGL